ncbi:MAG: citrate/2-methylcitrate synthase [Gemmatimonadota bacterium]
MARHIAARGLEGVIAAETALSFIDGRAGRLLYRGYDIGDLAKRGTFLEALFLLWNDALPTRAELARFSAELAGLGALPPAVLGVLRQLPSQAVPMAVLRTAVSVLGDSDPEQDDGSAEGTLRKSTRLVARVPTAVAAFHRIRGGHEPIPPDDSLSYSANFLYMLNGERPGPVAEKALDTSLLLYLEHGLNASTFTCRVIASTLSDLYSAVTGGIGALKGPLHGGANEKAMQMLIEIGEIGRVEDYIDSALAAGRKIMGFGHRVYRTEDPRATHLRRMSEELGRAIGDTRWFELSRAVETTMRDRKGLDCNVDFYCASVYHCLGLPLDLYTPMFAVGRMGGWCAHVMEQLENNRLIRPRAEYTGARDRPYVPMGER